MLQCGPTERGPFWDAATRHPDTIRIPAPERPAWGGGWVLHQRTSASQGAEGSAGPGPAARQPAKKNPAGRKPGPKTPCGRGFPPVTSAVLTAGMQGSGPALHHLVRLHPPRRLSPEPRGTAWRRQRRSQLGRDPVWAPQWTRPGARRPIALATPLPDFTWPDLPGLWFQRWQN